ncbi:MAG: TRAP transporter large permease subunit [Pseudomonadota bacterium]
MSEFALPLAMAVLTLAGILAGYRVGMVLAGAAAVFILISDLPTAFFNLLVSRIYANVLSNWLLVAVPMFIFMGLILEVSGTAERSLKAAQRALGGSAAGMGLSVLVIGVLLAASSGIVGASVVLLSLLALPRLVEAGYGDRASAGLVTASGTLAILIPPSVMLIILGDQLKTPVPSMFAGAIGPGLLLVAVYGAYVIWQSRALPRQEAGEATSPLRLLIDLGPLLALVVSVLGSIIAGLATPTEASGVGAMGAVLITMLYGKFSLTMLMKAATQTVITTSTVLFLMIGATCFSAVFKGIGGGDLVEAGIMAFGDGPFTVLAVVMVAIFLLGFVLDWLEITLILMPIFAPIVGALDFGNGLAGPELMIWFGILVAVNLQTSFLTPPFGFSLFYLRSAIGDRIATTDIYRGVLPFILLQLFVLALLIAFPGLITGLI